MDAGLGARSLQAATGSASTAPVPAGSAGATPSGTGAAFAAHVRRVREEGRASAVPGPCPAGAVPSASPVPDPAEHARLAKLREACVELEATLWSQVFRQMDSGFSAGNGKGPLEDNSATKSFREMLDTERGRQMARAGNGLAETLYQQLARPETATHVTKGPQP